jgi:hypothetical protein
MSSMPVVECDHPIRASAANQEIVKFMPHTPNMPDVHPRRERAKAKGRLRGALGDMPSNGSGGRCIRVSRSLGRLAGSA